MCILRIQHVHLEIFLKRKSNSKLKGISKKNEKL